jgi:hypothetical protein
LPFEFATTLPVQTGVISHELKGPEGFGAHSVFQSEKQSALQKLLPIEVCHSSTVRAIQ